MRTIRSYAELTRELCTTFLAPVDRTDSYAKGVWKSIDGGMELI